MRHGAPVKRSLLGAIGRLGARFGAPLVLSLGPAGCVDRAASTPPGHEHREDAGEAATLELGRPPACGGLHQAMLGPLEVRARAEVDGDRVFEVRALNGPEGVALLERVARELQLLVAPVGPKAEVLVGRLHRTAEGFAFRWRPRAQREMLTADWQDPSGAMGLRVELALPEDLEDLEGDGDHGARDPGPAPLRRQVFGAGLVQRAVGLTPADESALPFKAPARTP